VVVGAGVDDGTPAAPGDDGWPVGTAAITVFTPPALVVSNVPEAAVPATPVSAAVGRFVDGAPDVVVVGRLISTVNCSLPNPPHAHSATASTAVIAPRSRAVHRFM
jgi:hypothetical protein